MTLLELAQSSGFQVVGSNVVGVYREYPFSLGMSHRNGKTTLTISFSLDKRTPNALVKEMKKESVDKFQMVVNQNGILTCTFTTSRDPYQATVAALDLMTGKFSRAMPEIRRPEKCAICQQTDPESAALYNGHYSPVHRSCVDNMQEKNLSKLDNRKDGNIFTGLIGAIIFALIGALPLCLIEGMTWNQYPVLYVAIPFAAYQGYKLLNGRLGKFGPVAVFIGSVFTLFPIQVLTFYINNLVERMGYGIFDYVEYIFFNLSISDILQDSVTGYIFLVIAFFVGCPSFMQTKKQLRQQTANIGESLMSLSGNVSAPAGQAAPEYTGATVAAQSSYTTYTGDSSEKPPMEIDI